MLAELQRRRGLLSMAVTIVALVLLQVLPAATEAGASTVLIYSYDGEAGTATAATIHAVEVAVQPVRTLLSDSGFVCDPLVYRYATKGADEAAGAIRVVGRHLESVDDVFANPQLLKGRTPQQVEALIGDTAGWQVETLGRGSRQGQGWILREYTGSGNPTGRLIQWHPGGGHHGLQPYWKISSGPTGTVRIFE